MQTIDVFFDPTVSVIYDNQSLYPDVPPFHPSDIYPEYPWSSSFLGPVNAVYHMVREAFVRLSLDVQNYGTPSWNPLGCIIRPGDRVVVKPNAVSHYNLDNEASVFASITHPSILRAVMDYVIIALKGKGSIVIADAPLQATDFSAWIKIMSLDKMLEFYRNVTPISVQTLDLRMTVVKWILGFTPSFYRRHIYSDPRGYTDVDLQEQSAYSDLPFEEIKKFYGADYDVEETIRFHSERHHIYQVANTVLGSDVILSLPKLKVHKKVGITANLKGMVGIIGNKNCIPHCRRGSPKEGGDEYPEQLELLQHWSNRFRMLLLTKLLSKQRTYLDLIYLSADIMRRLLERALIKDSKTTHQYYGGSWHGNDTAWRMGLDLLTIALYGKEGFNNIGSSRRRFFSVVDGIIGGEGDGPLAPKENKSGIIIAGFNPVAVDWVAARLINFDPSKIRMLRAAKTEDRLCWRGSELPKVNSNSAKLDDLWNSSFSLNYDPPLGWKNYVELSRSA